MKNRVLWRSSLIFSLTLWAAITGAIISNWWYGPEPPDLPQFHIANQTKEHWVCFRVRH